MKSTYRKHRRGVTLIEVQVAAVTGLLITGGLLSFTRFNSVVWHGAMADTSTLQATQFSLQKIAPDIRAARSVVSGSSSATRLTLQLPAYDSSGNLTIPLTNGNTVSYYLSDTTGSTSVSNGTILWRSVNGTPDSAWSLRSGAGRVVLNTGGLAFSYSPSMSAAETVTVTVTARATSGTSTDQLTTSQEVVLRNKDL
jgi:Tfp pilus assembly protein PilV